MENFDLPMETDIVNKIHTIRDCKVMLDRDLAQMYGVETKRLKEAVRRNMRRFPPDFMFEMSRKEFSDWRSQFSSSKNIRMGMRYAPMCFTEQGVAMLSSVLNSEQAIHVNIAIIRTFTHMRETLMDHDELRREIKDIKSRLDEHDQRSASILHYLDQLINKPDPPRKMIGYKSDDR